MSDDEEEAVGDMSSSPSDMPSRSDRLGVGSVGMPSVFWKSGNGLSRGAGMGVLLLLMGTNGILRTRWLSSYTSTFCDLR
jgi:hypothetical protein